MKAKLVFVTLPARNPKNLPQFYERFFGIDFGLTYSETVVSYHAPILRDGVQLTIQQAFRDADTTTCYYAVDDLDAAIGEVREHGGKVVSEARALPVIPEMLPVFRAMCSAFYGVPADEVAQAKSIGRGAIVADPEGNLLGFLQLERFMHGMYSIGAHASPIAPEHLAAHRLTSAIGQVFESISSSHKNAHEG